MVAVVRAVETVCNVAWREVDIVEGTYFAGSEATGGDQQNGRFVICRAPRSRSVSSLLARARRLRF